MQTLFALLIFTYVGYGGSAVTRAGIYQSYQNCMTQRAAILPLVKSANGRDGQVICLPTNG